MFSSQFPKLDCEGLYAKTVQDGGFTVNARTGESPTKGFAVAREGFEVIIPGASPIREGQKKYFNASVPRYIGQYATKHCSELKQNSAYLGGWIYDGSLYLDISDIVETREAATILANNRNQLAFYDVANGVEVACDPCESELEHARRLIG